MKVLILDQYRDVLGAASDQESSKDERPFNWVEFAVITAGAAVAGAVMGAISGADASAATGGGSVTGGIIGGGLIAGSLGALGDRAYQRGPW